MPNTDRIKQILTKQKPTLSDVFDASMQTNPWDTKATFANAFQKVMKANEDRALKLYEVERAAAADDRAVKTLRLAQNRDARAELMAPIQRRQMEVAVAKSEQELAWLKTNGGPQGAAMTEALKNFTPEQRLGISQELQRKNIKIQGSGRQIFDTIMGVAKGLGYTSQPGLKAADDVDKREFDRRRRRHQQKEDEREEKDWNRLDKENQLKTDTAKLNHQIAKKEFEELGFKEDADLLEELPKIYPDNDHGVWKITERYMNWLDEQKEPPNIAQKRHQIYKIAEDLGIKAIDKQKTTTFTGELSKGATTSNQKELIKLEIAAENLKDLGRKAHLATELMTYKGNVATFLGKLYAKLNVGPFKLSTKAKEGYKTAAGFFAQVETEFNAYRKFITGAAAALREIQTLKDAMFSSKDDPVAFMGKFENWRSAVLRERRIRRALQREGLFAHDPKTAKQFAEMADKMWREKSDDTWQARYDELEAAVDKDGNKKYTQQQIFDLLIEEEYQ